MGLGARIVERSGKTPHVTFRWDPETDILTGSVKGGGKGKGGLTGSVELEGGDGSFVLLDVASGAIRGVEIVVWPDVRTVATLQPPGNAADGEVILPDRKAHEEIAAVEVDTPLSIETNGSESVFRIRVGAARRCRAVRVAEGLLVEVDDQEELAGLWLVGVPPFPQDEAGVL
jgi:hypothetical protein